MIYLISFQTKKQVKIVKVKVIWVLTPWKVAVGSQRSRGSFYTHLWNVDILLQYYKASKSNKTTTWIFTAPKISNLSIKSLCAFTGLKS